MGSPRDMIQRFQDAMSLVQKFEKPDLFITMTYNPGWEEIQNELLPAQIAQDRLDLLAKFYFHFHNPGMLLLEYPKFPC